MFEIFYNFLSFRTVCFEIEEIWYEVRISHLRQIRLYFLYLLSWKIGLILFFVVFFYTEWNLDEDVKGRKIGYPIKCLSIYLSIYLSILDHIYLSLSPRSHASIYLWLIATNYLSIYLCLLHQIYLSLSPRSHASIYLSIYLSQWQSTSSLLYLPFSFKCNFSHNSLTVFQNNSCLFNLHFNSSCTHSPS